MAESFVAVNAQSRQQTGTVVGSVQNAATGEYLNNARVGLKGGTTTVLTDESGRFRLADVPPGPQTLRVFFTGLDEQEIAVNVTAGQVAEQDIRLTSRARYGDRDGAVVMSEFVVETTRETNAAAIAVNEQRFSRNIKSVVSTDAFGEISENNLGEFIKWLPGVGVEYFANDITGINVRGFGADNTEITFNGLPSATASTESNSRRFEMRQSSTADIARVEVRKVPLPSDSSNAIGGSVNLIRKTAFEQSRRRIEYAASFNSEDEGNFTLDRTPAPGDQLMRKWRPSVRLSITDPVTKTFGYSFNYARSDVIAPQHWSQPNWNFGTTAAPTPGNPWMANPLLHDAPIRTVRDSYSLTLDWRPVRDLTLSANVGYFHSERTTRDDIRYRWNTRITGSEQARNLTDRHTTTLGPAGRGAIHYDTPLWRDDYNPKLDASLSARWNRRGWTIETAGGLSFAEHDFKDMENGFFNSTTFPLRNATLEGTNTRLWPTGSTAHTGIAHTSSSNGYTVNFYDINGYAPQTIELLDRNGQAVDWSKAANHTIRGARSRPSHTETQMYSYLLKARRSLGLPVPFVLEGGFQYQYEFRNRQRYDTNVWAFVGADGVPLTADDSASAIAADVLRPERDDEYNYPPIEHISMSKLYDIYRTHPNYFRYQEAESYRQNQTQPMHIAESTSALYLMGDTQLLRGRLNLVGGIRYERSEAEGRGFLHQQNNAYRKYADGTVVRSQDILDASGNLVESRGAPVFLPGVTAGSLAEAQLVYLRKGASGSGVRTGYFPSLHATFTVTENFLVRAAYAKTQARVRFDRSVIPNTTITEASNTTDVLGTISIRNPDLKPWTADNFDVRLDYYTKSGGVFGIGGFVKNIHDFQVSRDILLDTPEAAALWGFPDYVGYEVTTFINEGSARVSGIELEAQQQLDPFVPSWAKGVGVRASFLMNDLDGTPSRGSEFGSLNKQRGTLYVTYNRGKVRLGAGFIYQGEIFQQLENLGINANGYRILQPRKLIDLNLEYRFSRAFRVFASVRNLTGESNLSERFSDNSAPYARVRSDNAHGANYTVGIRGTF